VREKWYALGYSATYSRATAVRYGVQVLENWNAFNPEYCLI